MMLKNRDKTVAHFHNRGPKAGDVGIEIEIEGRGALLEVASRGWMTHKEDSLRKGGVEFVTKTPIPEAEVFKNATTLRASIDRATAGDPKAMNLLSHLGSTHIHVNQLNETMETVLGQAVIWTVIEPVIMRFCGPMRDGNLFCMSNYDTGDVVEFINSFCSYIDSGGVKGAWNRGKYSAQNFGRLIDFGTLEYRCFPTSIDPAEIQGWARWLCAIRRMARVANDKTFATAVRFAEQNPLHFARQIMGENMRFKDKLFPDTLGALIDFGAAQAYEMTRTIKKWHNMPFKAEVPEEKKLGPKFVKARFAIRDAPLPEAFADDEIEMDGGRF